MLNPNLLISNPLAFVARPAQSLIRPGCSPLSQIGFATASPIRHSRSPLAATTLTFIPSILAAPAGPDLSSGTGRVFPWLQMAWV